MCDPYFVHRGDSCGRMNLYTIQKCIVTIQMLTYSMATNAMDEYVCIGKSMTMESLNIFVKPSSFQTCVLSTTRVRNDFEK